MAEPPLNPYQSPAVRASSLRSGATLAVRSTRCPVHSNYRSAFLLAGLSACLGRGERSV